VQLWGPVNAGKSSLLNALCGDTLAAEGPEPGLTRDVIEGRMEHQGFVLRLFDAPGTGHDESPLNVAAAQLAEQWRREADLTLELVPPGSATLGVGQLVVYSRADEDPTARKPGVSVRNPASLVALKQTLLGHFIGRLLALPESLRIALPPAMLARLASAPDPRTVINS
jgi:tRNA modification GTPase